MSVDFDIPVYQGPLDLLLALIRKNEVNIYDIPIALITDQFLDYIHSAEEVKIGDLSEFYSMAAHLIWIKSQMLLPIEVDFGDDYQDPRDELVERLLEYSKFKKYSELLTGCGSDSEIRIERKPSQFELPLPDDEIPDDLTANDLLLVFRSMLENLNSLDEKVFNIYEDVTENEKTALMFELLEQRESIMFSDLFVKKSASHIICSFMAVLNAVKEMAITVEQQESFGDIVISKRK